VTTTDSDVPPDARETLRQLAAVGWVKFLGLEILEASGDGMTVRWPVSPDHHQPYGIVHGGVYCTVIETVASLSGAAWFGDRGHVVGVSNQTDFLRAVREGELTAVSTPVHRGRLHQLWLVEIRDGDDRLVSRGQVRLQNITSAEGLGRS
jgi:1,4-dihydroxy-2-naphthoyl-CoA hydrolase